MLLDGKAESESKITADVVDAVKESVKDTIEEVAVNRKKSSKSETEKTEK